MQDRTPPFDIGQHVETIKGAKFWGQVTACWQIPNGEWRADVYAIHPEFEGTIHIYPTKQLQLRVPKPAPDYRMM